MVSLLQKFQEMFRFLEEAFKDLVRGNDMKTPILLNSFLQKQVRSDLQ